ncbi:MAG: Lrp/AsnC family transcriptional regulator [Oscillospiraceae bacterium]
MKDATKILKILEKDCRTTPAEIATMTGMTEEEVAAAAAALEKENVIIGYTALINWDRADEDAVTALIEVKVTPQFEAGYDRLASRIYQYEEVESLYLMSGAYDFCVIISGKSMKEVARFVIEKLAPINGVNSTATHFILHKYKEKGRLFGAKYNQEERPLFI